MPDYLATLQQTRCKATDFAPPSRAGIYAIFAADIERVGAVCVPQHQLLYIGKSGKLSARDHFVMENSGFSTIRRTLGALLRDELRLVPMPRGRGPAKTNYQNFRFDPASETRLSSWMFENLQCGAVACEQDIHKTERRLIHECEPPLNLTNWKNPQGRLLRHLRAECRRQAQANQYLRASA